MSITNTDTRGPASVAPLVASQDKFICAPSNNAAPVASPVRMWPDELDLTEAEGYAIEALRRYQAASADPALLAYLQAWECLQMYVDAHRAGVFSLDDALDAAGATRGPALFSAVVTIAGLFDLFVPQSEQTERSEQSEGSRPNG